MRIFVLLLLYILYCIYYDKKKKVFTEQSSARHDAFYGTLHNTLNIKIANLVKFLIGFLVTGSLVA